MTITVEDAIILVAGRGSRLRPLTDERPKCLLEVGGQPLLLRLLRQLAHHGIRNVVLVAGYRGEDIERELEASRYEGGLPTRVEVVEVDDWEHWNNAASLQRGLMELEAERSFLLL